MTGRLTIGIVGAGAVGAILGQALAAAGHRIVGYSTSSDKNIERAEVLLPGVPRLDMAQVIKEADFVVFAVPGNQLVELISGVARAGLFKPGQLLAHTSADFGYSVFDPAISVGVIPLAIHPAMNFTGTSIDLTRLRESFFAVSAPNVAIPIAEALVIEMGGEPFVVAEENRGKYSEAISVADNFSKMIVNQSIGMLEEVGLVDARAILAPLLRSAVEQALAVGHQPIDPDELLA